MTGIIWLASYPKSGNTWLRVFLSRLTYKDWNPKDLNSLPIDNAGNRRLIDEIAGVESSDLTGEQIALLLPRAYEHLAAGFGRPLFLKTHQAWLHNSAGEPVLSTAATAAAVYVVRNPLDVAVSYAHHFEMEIGRAIQEMQDPENAMAREKWKLWSRVPQSLLDWSGHARSWLEGTSFPLHIMRYEDMVARPLETFTAMVRFAGLICTPEEINAGLDASSFTRLQNLERQTGFREKAAASGYFFRQGKAGGWREVLTDAQVRDLIAAHGDMMRRLGYLDELNTPLC